MLLVVSVIPSVTLSHPNDSPLTFKKHTTSDGRTVFSNIPLSCFKSGYMTCWHYHPVAGKPDNLPSYKPRPDARTELYRLPKKLGGIIKLSINGICHQPGDNSYDRTENYTEFVSMAECLKNGGKPAKK
jgi:hypothetical protein